MNEPRDSPQRRKQFLVICTIMVTFIAHSLIQSGALLNVYIEDGIFPGGDFVFKHTQRDYAASNSLLEAIGEDMGLKPKQFADKLYTVYLDDPSKVSGRSQRFAGGFLAIDKELKQFRKELLEKTKNLEPVTEHEFWELPAFKLWTRLRYQSVDLPSVNCAVIQFPFTNGFVSAMVHSIKVLPKLRKYAEEKVNGEPVTIISTCSIREKMCTHYAPLYKGKKFLLGLEDPVEHLEKYKKQPWVTTASIKRRVKRVFPPAKYIFNLEY